jgi:AcrR family transcriptional regulator
MNPMTATPPSQADAPRMRKDVARNRALLLQTADKLLATRGLDLTFHELAEAAGLGVGTVYRHFADRDTLLNALIDQRFTVTRDILLDAEKIEDPLQALCTGILRVCEYHFADRATLQAMLSNAERHRQLAVERLQPVTQRLVSRAIASGRIRQDFSHTDLPLIYLMAGSLKGNTEQTRPDLWRRYVEAIVDGFIADIADRLGHQVPAASDEDIAAIMEAQD